MKIRYVLEGRYLILLNNQDGRALDFECPEDKTKLANTFGWDQTDDLLDFLMDHEGEEVQDPGYFPPLVSTYAWN